MAASGVASSDGLTRRHGIKFLCKFSVEECALAVGNVVGCNAIVSASKMNNAVVLFLNTIEKANELVQTGVVINDAFTHVLPLSSPSRKIVVSNVPPFVSDASIAKELSFFGKIVSPIRKIALSCKSPLLKHVVSFRRQVYMILKNNADELNLSFNVKVEDFNYTVYATSENIMKCFGCGKINHLIRDCPEKIDESATVQTNTQSNPSEVVSVTEDVVDPAAAVASVSGGSVGKKPTMAEVTADRFSVSDLMIFDTVNLSSDINTDKTTTTGKQVSEGVVGELEVETESVFKVPNKRKKVQQTKVFKQTKKDKNEVESLVPENDSDSSDSNISDCSYLSSQNENENQTTVYKVEDISKFLKETKGLPGVQVEDYFPDRSTFINDAKILMKEGAFADKEVFRLRKIVSKLRKQNLNDEKQDMV